MGYKDYKDNVFGSSLPATIYVLLYTLYTITFSFKLNLYVIRSFYVVYYALTIWYLFKSFRYYSNSTFLKRLTLMFVVVVIYGLFLFQADTTGWKGDVNPLGNLMLYVFSVLPIYPFYYFGRKGKISPYWFRIMFILFCINTYALYYENETRLQEMLTGSQEEFTNNSGYIIVSLLPLIAFFNKKNIVQYASLVIIIVATILCFKRGAIVVGFLAILYFLFKNIKTQNNTRRIVALILGVAVLFVLYGYLDSLMLSNDYFYQRVISSTEGDSSGRDNIYGFLINYFFSSENGIIGMLLGNGSAATVKILGTQAHNDWLEFAIDFGLLGVVVYFLYWLSNYKYYKYARKHLQEEVVVAMGMVLIINFGRTQFSMSFNDMSFFSAMLIGYTMAMVDNSKNCQNVNDYNFQVN